MKTLGEKIRELRKSLGLTQEELGKKLNLGKSTISQYENNINTPDIEILKKMASIFSVSLDDLLNYSPALETNTIENPDYPHKITSRDKKQYLEYIKSINETFFMNDEFDEEDKKAILDTMNEIFWMAKTQRKKKKDK